MKEKLEELYNAKKQVAEGSLTIWNTRLQAMVNAGDLKGALDQLLAPIEGIADNCGCGNNCRCAPSALEQLGDPVTTRR